MVFKLPGDKAPNPNSYPLHATLLGLVFFFLPEHQRRQAAVGSAIVATLATICFAVSAGQQ